MTGAVIVTKGRYQRPQDKYNPHMMGEKPLYIHITGLCFTLSLSLSFTVFFSPLWDVDCCAHKKSFNTAIPVRSLGPYMRVHYCTYIVHILV